MPLPMIDIAFALNAWDGNSLAAIDGIADELEKGHPMEPVKLLSVPGAQLRIIDGRKRCYAVWKCRATEIPALVVPYSPIVHVWLDLQGATGDRNMNERPVDYVCRIFDALPEYEEAVFSGTISYRQVRDELGLASHLPVFRAIRKRRPEKFVKPGLMKAVDACRLEARTASSN